MTESKNGCWNCKKAIACEIGQICTLTKENLFDRGFRICEYYEKVELPITQRK